MALLLDDDGVGDAVADWLMDFAVVDGRGDDGERGGEDGADFACDLCRVLAAACRRLSDCDLGRCRVPERFGVDGRVELVLELALELGFDVRVDADVLGARREVLPFEAGVDELATAGELVDGDVVGVGGQSGARSWCSRCTMR